MTRLISDTLSTWARTARAVYDDLATTYSRMDLIPAGLSVMTMLLLKRHYSLASPTQLEWMLMPTAKLVSWVTSAHLVPELGVGYADFAKGIIVAPACAGINFMVMAFGLTAWYGLHSIRRLAGQLPWLLVALLAAYGLTLVVNTVRIVLSMSLYQADIYGGWLTVARVHRLAGVVVYFSALWLHVFVLRRVLTICYGHPASQESPRRMRVSDWWVWSWYLLVALAVPLANRAWQNGSAAFGEHCVTVLLACSASWALILVMTRLLHHMAKKTL